MKTQREFREDTVRRIIENDLYYFVKCPHCAIVFFIEEAVDGGYRFGLSSEPTFRLTCPKCKGPIEQASVKRLKLSLEKVVEQNVRLLPQRVEKHG